MLGIPKDNLRPTAQALTDCTGEELSLLAPWRCQPGRGCWQVPSSSWMLSAVIGCSWKGRPSEARRQCFKSAITTAETATSFRRTLSGFGGSGKQQRAGKDKTEQASPTPNPWVMPSHPRKGMVRNDRWTITFSWKFTSSRLRSVPASTAVGKKEGCTAD